MARRHFQERKNIIDEMTNTELIERYRLDREGILYLETNLNNILAPKTQRNHSLSSIQKILVTLRYLASGEIQLNDSDIHAISQPSVSRVIGEVINALSNPAFVSRFIKFPLRPDQIQQTKQDFFGTAQFPNVVGIIDCTHIQLKGPAIDEPAYVNRMGYHSINTQIVFDSQDMIIDLVARWPGATHDSRILRESGLWALMEMGALGQGHHYLLGDSGYPCKRWLLTPYLHPQPGSQGSYNRAHKTTRSKVERGIGQLKARWGILRGEIRLSPVKVCKVITSCGVLHNLCKVRNIPIPEAANIVPNIVNQGPQLQIQDGLRYRDYIANTYF